MMYFFKRRNTKKVIVMITMRGPQRPLLALNMLSRALLAHDIKLEIDHVFSCEIEPYKQAYIERNFSPPILFRDIKA